MTVHTRDNVIFTSLQVLGGKLEVSEREAIEAQKKLSDEKDEVATKHQQLVETHELLLSEMASIQSDLATANSQANTHKLASEKVNHLG